MLAECTETETEIETVVIDEYWAENDIRKGFLKMTMQLI